MKYHAGELQVQALAGVQEAAGKVSGVMRSTIPGAAQTFLRQQRWLLAASLDSDSRVWASILVGEPGFMKIPDEKTIRITAASPPDSLIKNLRDNPQIGLLAIEFSTRRRAKLKGKAEIPADGAILVRLERVYSLCPKYIQAREPIEQLLKSPGESRTQISNQLTEAQTLWISQADTFFIASFHPETGADASHRGGNPGFIQVVDSRQLIFPDYTGNRMFNTLGNITENPSAGLVFLDFVDGRILQLSGKAKVIWDQSLIKDFAGAERLVAFQVEEVRETAAVLLSRWQFLGYSPFNPEA